MLSKARVSSVVLHTHNFSVQYTYVTLSLVRGSHAEVRTVELIAQGSCVIAVAILR